MSRYSHNYVVLTIAMTALLSGCSIYLLARPGSLYAVANAITIATAGPLPSFFHTLAFALMSTLIMTRRNSAIGVITIWTTIELLAEIAQHSAIPVSALLQRYQESSTFDPLDLMAIVAAGFMAALIMIHHYRPLSVTTVQCK